MSTPLPRQTHLYSAGDVWALGEDFHGELVDGQLVLRSPTNVVHAVIETNVALVLSLWCREHAPTWRVATGEVGFVLAHDPDVVRGADVAMVDLETIARTTTGFVEGAPLVAVEVLSPGNTVSDMERKLEDYLRAGTRSVWIVDPAYKRIMIWRTLEQRSVFSGDGEVTDPALPGFKTRTAEIFRE